MSSTMIEIKTKSLHEIVRICERNVWDLKKVKIETEIWENIKAPDEYYTKMFLKWKKK